MKRTRTQIGDVFAAKLNDGIKCFQYIANDLTQLDSQVIRSFKRKYSYNEILHLEELVKGEVEFYAHVFLRTGLKLGYWEKVGHIAEVGIADVLFRNTNDYGRPEIKVSTNWHVWKINEPFAKVGKLEGSNQKAEIGIVIAPDSIVHRMQTGKYDFVYPGF